MDNKLYYIQRHSSGYVGNCLLFWHKNGNGYTCNLDNAKLFDQEEMEKLIKMDKGEKFTAWSKEYMDSISVRHVDAQFLNENNGIKLV